MNEEQRYQQMDLPFYHNEIAPILPEEVLDFHTHVWISSVWKSEAVKGKLKGEKYMVTTKDYSIESLINDGKMMFPDRPYKCVCFGQPTPAVDLRKTNEYTAKTAANNLLYPLIITGKNLIELQKITEQVYIDKSIKQYIINIIFASRYPNIEEIENLISYGASPRASIGLMKASKAMALLDGRNYVTPEDIKEIAPDILRHRITTTYEAEAENVTSDDIIKILLDNIKVP